MNKAQQAIAKLNDSIEYHLVISGYSATSDNNDIIEALQESAVSVKDILDQETYIFSDGSYITRLNDDFWLGDDVDLFEIEADIANEEKIS